MKPQVNKEHYNFSTYVDSNRWMSFYHQLLLIERYGIESLLEIGPGNKVLGKILTGKIKYVSMDIDIALKPEVKGSVLNLPFKPESFEAVVCFQVLEHFPFESFAEIIDNLFQVSSKYIFISLPFANHKISMEIHLPVINRFGFRWLIERFYKTHKFDGQHYWEVGTKGYGRKFIRSFLRERYILTDEFVPLGNSNHIFYVLEKK